MADHLLAAQPCSHVARQRLLEDPSMLTALPCTSTLVVPPPRGSLRRKQVSTLRCALIFSFCSSNAGRDVRNYAEKMSLIVLTDTTVPWLLGVSRHGKLWGFAGTNEERTLTPP